MFFLTEMSVVGNGGPSQVGKMIKFKSHVDTIKTGLTTCEQNVINPN